MHCEGFSFSKMKSMNLTSNYPQPEREKIRAYPRKNSVFNSRCLYGFHKF